MTDPAAIMWVSSTARYPDLKDEVQYFIALDADGHDIGIVRRVEHGRESGEWQWFLTRINPGAPLNRPRDGTAETASEAARALVECWLAFRKYYRLDQ